jgi:beta-glucosidase/6-phospho-beta-glucosidase/beta-galactosidase
VPPQIKSPLAAIIATINVIRAHRLATARIHELQPRAYPGAPLRGVGLVNSLEVFDPYRPGNGADIAATAAVDELWNWALPQAAVSAGPALAHAVSLLQVSAPEASAADISRLTRRLAAEERYAGAGSPVVDWMGVNYYTRSLIESRQEGPPLFHVPPGPVGDNGWSVYPEGLERIIRATKQRFPALPIIVTEHGMADEHDRYRPELIRQSLSYLDRAKFGYDQFAPVDVRGYFHWSLTDNFEWQYGYAHRFGLVAILYELGLTRVPRASAGAYKREITSRQQALGQ